ncbi:MAG: hypothetical protein JRJ06_06930 [Deltaproteobacteria bacterium]|nr:hypothetical protein [Deltaproteobacteria bacterium]
MEYLGVRLGLVDDGLAQQTCHLGLRADNGAIHTHTGVSFPAHSCPQAGQAKTQIPAALASRERQDFWVLEALHPGAPIAHAENVGVALAHLPAHAVLLRHDGLVQPYAPGPAAGHDGGLGQNLRAGHARTSALLRDHLDDTPMGSEPGAGEQLGVNEPTALGGQHKVAHVSLLGNKKRPAHCAQANNKSPLALRRAGTTSARGQPDTCNAPRAGRG